MSHFCVSVLSATLSKESIPFMCVEVAKYSALNIGNVYLNTRQPRVVSKDTFVLLGFCVANTQSNVSYPNPKHW